MQILFGHATQDLVCHHGSRALDKRQGKSREPAHICAPQTTAGTAAVQRPDATAAVQRPSKTAAVQRPDATAAGPKHAGIGRKQQRCSPAGRAAGCGAARTAAQSVLPSGPPPKTGCLHARVGAWQSVSKAATRPLRVASEHRMPASGGGGWGAGVGGWGWGHAGRQAAEMGSVGQSAAPDGRLLSGQPQRAGCLRACPSAAAQRVHAAAKLRSGQTLSERCEARHGGWHGSYSSGSGSA